MHQSDLLIDPLTGERKPPKTLKLQSGIQSGKVIGTMLPNNLITVQLDNGKPVDCIWAAGIISGLLGFKLSYIPPLETRVLVYVTSSLGVCYIIGSFPDAYVNVVSPERSITDPDGMNYTKSAVFTSRKKGPIRMAASHKPPIDLTEGEIQLDNLMGVGISLLRHLASLQAGDLARVECHLMDDMVRILSGMFVHHSAFGDMRISNDAGKLNVEWNGTSLEHEAWGCKRPADDRAKMKNPDHPDLGQPSQIDGFNDDGRWRFSQYLGWLGNFINVFVTDPAKNLGTLADGQLRSGKFRFHVNDDGSMIVQSVTDIVLEKVVRIPVPMRLKREDDPKGNRSDSTLGKQEFLKLWQPLDTTNVFEMAFQLREYARWLNNRYSLARFHQMDKDFRVPSEAETPQPDPLAAQPDRVTADLAAQTTGPTVGYRQCYSCIRILRDGSIVFWDGYGNSVSMSDNGIQVASTSDLLIEAAGSVNIVAGRDINMVARQNLNLTAMLDTVRIAAKQALKTLVEVGNMVMDFLTPTSKVNIRGGLNVNNACSISGTNGEINSLGAVRGTLGFFAPLTAGPYGYIPHMGHVFLGPAVVEVSEELGFKYQTSYGTETLYQSLAQSALEKNEHLTNITIPWDMKPTTPQYGFSWPGAAARQKVPQGENLNLPADSLVSNRPKPMIPRPPSMRVKPT